ncbi:MAG TPA: hypothetical protein VGN69_11160 [Solirubrobacteraceae bacterium]|jgi:hypothetical protein|nr:hypothetical protein [Solirubrobacteraceae bacterium]
MGLAPQKGRSPINARQEAYERLGGRYQVRVLEPSPPAVTDPPWFADDPTDPLHEGPRRRRDDDPPLVSPVSTGDLLWDDLAREDPALAGWCAERWLGAYHRLPAPPEGLVTTRQALHRVAEHVISPTRQRANGKVGLRYTQGGFGTPFFGNDVQIRLSRDVLTVQMGTEQTEGRLTTLKDAAEFIGFDLTRFDAALQEQPLDIDLQASDFLAELFGFGTSVLEQLRAEASESLDPSRVQLWPEHFDLSVELGPEPAGGRAAYGCSPGDDLHLEPYLYVAPWSAPPGGELWQASGFHGAEMTYRDLLAAEDQRAAALDFYRSRLAALTPARN